MNSGTGTAAHFGERLAAAVGRAGRLCVGIDPSPALLDRWNLPDTADGLRRFCDAVIDAVRGEIAVVKPQSAFFERMGSPGIAVLEEVCGLAQDAGLLVILDAKRGDISMTCSAYADAYLTGGHAMRIDALTVSPYLGFGSLRPFVDAAVSAGRGLFVLASTSNPEAPPVQTAVLASGSTVERDIWAQVVRENERWVPAAGPGAQAGPIGVVVGATIAAGRLPLGQANGFLLAPGLGAQGATPADVAALFKDCADRALPVMGRGILRAGANPSRLRARVRQARDEIEEALGA